MSIVGLGACIMVAVGFKAKYSASFLVALLSIFNVFINNWCVFACFSGSAGLDVLTARGSTELRKGKKDFRLIVRRWSVHSAHPQRDFLKYDL